MVKKNESKPIDTFELRSMILRLGQIKPSDAVREVMDELSRLNFTHVSYGGYSYPITEELITKRVYKAQYLQRVSVKSKREKIGPIPFPAPSDSGAAGDADPGLMVEMDIRSRFWRKDNTILKKKYDALSEQYSQLKKMLDIREASSLPMQDFRIPSYGNQKDHSVAVALASDWHYEEMITPESVNMLNSFSLPVADARIKKFFSNSVKLLHKEQKESHIKTMVLALLGDFITGNIHEDNVESSQLGVGEALWAIKSRIHSGIKFLLDNSDVNLVIPCHSGNHGRHTKKQRIANEKENSLEWIIYKSLAETWAGNHRVKFLVGDSYHSFVEVFPGYTIRFHHGHFVKYAGGVGGITIPINKAISMWNRNRPAQLDCMGHFHQYCDGGNFVVNGSLIGYSPYAVSIKGVFEKPSQSFFLINGKHLEKTCSSKIFLEDK